MHIFDCETNNLILKPKNIKMGWAIGGFLQRHREHGPMCSLAKAS